MLLISRAMKWSFDGIEMEWDYLLVSKGYRSSPSEGMFTVHSL